jgi:subtilase family serine protease
MKHISVLTLMGLSFCSAFAFTTFTSAQSATQMRGQINERLRTVLPGNLHAAARNPAFDRGAVPVSLPLDHVQLLLQRPAEKEAALTAYVDSLNDTRSPNFHKWLTPQQLGTLYGPEPSDISTVTDWLRSHGFTVNTVHASGTIVDFSGNAAQMEETFHPALHALRINDEDHVANTVDPSIPTALSGVIRGVVSLNDFHPHPMYALAKAPVDAAADDDAGDTFASGSATLERLVPGDLATIYNLTPLFAAGYSGQGQTIVVVEDTNVYSTADWTKFRSTFGLSGYTSGSFTQTHPGNCTNPGTNSNEIEAIVDAEWASAAAPSAAIVLASCKDTATPGILTALENIVNGANPPKIISVSYGESESMLGAAMNATINSVYKAAAAEGISIFASSGDWGAAVSDYASTSTAAHGVNVSGYASTPYNTAVGGTDFYDTATGSNGSYWNTSNSGTYASAKSYMPEIPWNNSCAGSVLANHNGYSTGYGTHGFCNSSAGSTFLSILAAGGGPSGCATGAPSIAGEVNGTCKGYAKPVWQSEWASTPSTPADGVRDVPDVSLFASNGAAWGHSYVFCWSDPASAYSAKAAPCTGAPNTWSHAGGTSFAAPIMAAIQSLVNQETGSAWGLTAGYYYALFNYQAVTEGWSCNSASGTGENANCIFNDVTIGDINVNCTGRVNCYNTGGTYGVLSTSATSYLPAYTAGSGWDFATGLGSINAYNLVFHWNSVMRPSAMMQSVASLIAPMRFGRVSAGEHFLGGQ